MHIRRDLAAREEPDTDALAIPLGGINTAVVLVESIAVGLVVVVVNGTTNVGPLVRGLDVAITRAELATEPGFVDRVARVGVQGNLVGRLLVCPFDNIDLAVVGPVGTKHPAV